MKRRLISIVGSGPSGFYTAHHLLNTSKVPLEVTLWERLPVPFGLSRYGVAPDHPSVKNCEQTFTKTAQEFSKPGSIHKFNFFGNCEVGKDIKLATLLEKQDVVILSYGCTVDNKLGIPGESDTKGVFTSRKFVNWYNGHPDYAFDTGLSGFDWSRVKKVGIIGNGNVALDLARLLLTCNVDSIWKNTDINPNALNTIKRAPIEEVKLIARRDFPRSKFTNKELRELWMMEEHGIRGFIDPKYFQPSQWDMPKQERAFKRCVDLCSEFLKPLEERSSKYKKLPQPSHGFNKFWELDYLKTPMMIKRNEEGYISSLELYNNDISSDGKVLPNENEKVEYEMDLLITSLGYKGSPLCEFDDLNIKFDVNHISNKRGRVVDQNDNPIEGLYTSGWIRRGASGVIMKTMADAFNLADEVMADLPFLRVKENIGLPCLDSTKYTTWNDAVKILNYELEQGKIANKPREKLLTVEEMLQVAEKYEYQKEVKEKESYRFETGATKCK